MELTGRQREFLSRFLDFYRDAEGPLHYSHVADRLGISKITAYDMLKLLETRGLVRAEYVLPEREAGPGRSAIMFAPTEQARALFARLAGDEWDEAEWKQVRQRILEPVRPEEFADYQDVLAQIVARIPEQENPMLYAAEMITALILTLHQIANNTASSLEESLSKLGLPGEKGLNALAGLSVGLSFVEQANRRVTRLLASYAGRYQDILSQLSANSRRRLSEFAQEVVRRIQPSGSRPTGP